MKKLSIREHVGDWVYYLTSLTFKEVGDYVVRVDQELHKSEVLSDMIQRSITNNKTKIANYITHQDERFFNALVLAVYDGDPQWREIELDYGDGENYNLGVLEFNGCEKIFPVDGQHRVEGIKEVLSKERSYDGETIPVIFIGHKNDVNGMKRTRRLFSTLNRYAKPVSLNDIIALDEDDSIAIASRYVIENLELFKNKRIRNDKQKAIPDKDKIAFTNIISLYDCNKVLLEYFIEDEIVKGDDGKIKKGASKIEHYCRFRPVENRVVQYQKFVEDFWKAVSKYVTAVARYLESSDEQAAYDFRNSDGGNLLFRPIGQKPFVKVAVALFRKYNDWEAVFGILDRIDYDISNKPWKNIVWNDINKKMISSTSPVLLELIMRYMVGELSLSGKEIDKLVDEYKSKQLYEGMSHNEVLLELRGYQIKK